MKNADTESQSGGSEGELSLSQAVLAPLDAIFKAQIHAGRSYINMLWQMAYPHLPVDSKGRQIPFRTAYKAEGSYIYEDFDGTLFTLDDAGNKQPSPAMSDEDKDASRVNLYMPYQFPMSFQAMNGDQLKEYVMQIPAIAMVPSTPLGIDEANITFEMAISRVEDHKQLRSSETKNFAASRDGDGFSETKRPWYLVERPQSIVGNISSGSSSSTDSKIGITIKLTKSPVPAALEKSLTMLTQAIFIKENDKQTT